VFFFNLTIDLEGLMKYNISQQTVAHVVMTLAVISLIGSFYSTTDKQTKQLLENESTIERLRNEKSILLGKARGINAKTWQVQLSILTLSMEVLRERDVSIETKTIAWKKFRRSYSWAVQNNVQYYMNQNRINYLLGANFLELPYPTQVALIDELERKLEDTKRASKEGAQQKQDVLDREKIPSVSIKFLSITA
jgi:hypothetical protein